MSGVKRKRVVVTMEQKLNAIQRLENGESVKLISEEFGVGKSTVKDWRQNKKAIQDFCTQIESEKVLSSRRTLKKPINEQVDDALWLWFIQERRKGTPLTGPILKQKAEMLHSKFENGGKFAASDGWFYRWKKRHGVHFLSVCGEKLSANPDAAEQWKSELEDLIKKEGLQPEQVYNMDETGLNYKRLPDKTFARNNEKSAAGFKMNKERVTVAVCSNSSGTHKLPLLVIGKSKKPRAFKNINVTSLPVTYKNQRSAWMDSYIFKDWFINDFVPKVTKHLKSLKLPVKAVLVLDNAPTHPENIECEEEPGIKCIFLPPHVTSIVQPMDQGVIECLKRRYKTKLLSEILAKMEFDGKSLIDALKAVNIKDVILMVAAAFHEIPSSTFVKSWRKAWPDIEKIVESSSNDICLEDDVPKNETADLEENVSLLNDLRKLPNLNDVQLQDVQEWVIEGDDDLENEMLTDDQIVQAVINEDEEEEELDLEEDDEETKISHAEGREALQLAADYIEQQSESSAVDVMFIKKWRDYAFKKSMENKKQKKITDFLNLQ